MKIHQPILLLSLSLASALALLPNASAALNTHFPALSHNHHHKQSHSQKGHSRTGAASSQLTPAAASQRRGSNNRNANVPQGLSIPTELSAPSASSSSSLRQQKQQQSPGNSKIEVAKLNGKTPAIRSATQYHKRTKAKKSTSFAKRAIDPPKYRPPTPRKGSLVDPSPSTETTTASPIPTTPLLLLPDSRSVWHTGSYQTVKWSRKYLRTLPNDTTVDIVLVDSTTNRKVFSLKRFIPFKKGSAQVWVPVTLPERGSFVLVLELYRGRSQEQVLGALASSTSSSSLKQVQQHSGDSLEKLSEGPADDTNNRPSSNDVFSTIVRRSDISIATGPRKVPRDSPYPGSKGGGSLRKGLGTGSAGTHHDINNDDYYVGASDERPFEFLPEEMREEYPNTVRPLELEHTFGLHQKVYSLTPYTLKWQIPTRVAELLEYARQMQRTIGTLNKQQQQQRTPWTSKSTFLAKVLVELVADQTMKPISVLAKDVPAETMFQYLSIQDRVPQAFYRLRVQMVVVQVKLDGTTVQETAGGGAMSGKQQARGMEGWEFPSDGEVIDRYEAVTRRFWVSQGAL
ncbi:hypothetical protein BC939DRAFT_442831 [Gamsiella multidivaricata]|uniref:uncharacterized protein n=1 Tax=Gamsiella multidivaricata TaxID=101098 RepID=UPI002220E8D5|nr:uncharacterized protein BC939DRAFT_442831 [Gamsiella multidivaricata]KAG0367539.1 hypothetical protein BGZ54_003698 [Gamsiella multidivaricata]KAI7828752.1 hypothetical protein BC939DRAFT_442831 [Gamsiella multidivaricata]